MPPHKTHFIVADTILTLIFCYQAHGEQCAGCKGRIMDRYLVKVSGKTWHTSCLKCCMCGLELGKEATCYTKEDKIYCKTDYARFAQLFVCLHDHILCFQLVDGYAVFARFQLPYEIYSSHDRLALPYIMKGVVPFLSFEYTKQAQRLHSLIEVIFRGCILTHNYSQWCFNHVRQIIYPAFVEIFFGQTRSNVKVNSHLNLASRAEICRFTNLFLFVILMFPLGSE